MKKETTNKSDSPQVRFLYVPYMRQMRDKLRKEYAKNTAQFWIPVETSLLSRYEFATLLPHSRYIYVAILLHCGGTGTEEIPTNTRFLANIFGVDERTIAKSLDELENAKLLVERKKEREEKNTQTDRVDGDDSRVSMDSKNLFQNENQSENENGLVNETSAKSSSEKKHSIYSIEECRKYVEQCKINGESIQSPNALANHLHKSGEADALITAMLYPENQEEIDARIFGEPKQFTDEPCAVCFGAKMEIVKDKGARACNHCKNERGKSTGLEPKKGETNDEPTD